MTAQYDRIGINYADLRKPDPRIAAAVDAALGLAELVLNVGAGTGSYEPEGRRVTAVEPSIEMIRRRPRPATRSVQAVAGNLPFADKSFDAATAILTIHHWPDKAAGLREVRRVTKGRIVLLTFDPKCRPWLIDYLPELAALDEGQMPDLQDYAKWIGPVTVSVLPVPHDCTDGFLYAYWRRPQAYLDPRIRSGSSSFWAIRDAASGLDRLARDLESGDWQQRYAALLEQDEYDAGYRIVVSEA